MGACTVGTPDWSLWLSVPGAALFECVELSLGIDPDGPPNAFRLREQQTAEFQKRLSLLRRHVSRGSYEIRPCIGTTDRDSIITRVPVLDFVRWAEKQGWKLPEQLRSKPTRADTDTLTAEIKALRAELASLKAAPPPPPPAEELHPRARNTAAKIIAGLVLAYHGTSAHGRINGITEVLSELERVGVTVSEDTLRKWLQDGAELIPKSPATREN
jgi:type II secretory pathway component PulJ